MSYVPLFLALMAVSLLSAQRESVSMNWHHCCSCWCFCNALLLYADHKFPGDAKSSIHTYANWFVIDYLISAVIWYENSTCLFTISCTEPFCVLQSFFVYCLNTLIYNLLTVRLLSRLDPINFWGLKTTHCALGGEWQLQLLKYMYKYMLLTFYTVMLGLW